MHFECPAQEEGQEELLGPTPLLPVDMPSTFGAATGTASPPIPPPLPDHFNPRRVENHAPILDGDEEMNPLPSRFTMGRGDTAALRQRTADRQ